MHVLLLLLLILASPSQFVPVNAGQGDDGESSGVEGDYVPYFDHVQVKWFAPFLSGGGYSSEAMAFAGTLDLLDSVTSIERRHLSQIAASKGEDYIPEKILPFSMSMVMVHHGDSPAQSHIDGMTLEEHRLLEAHFDLPTGSVGGIDGRTANPDDFPHGDRREDTLIIGGAKNVQKKILQIVVCHSEPGAWHAPQPRYHTTQCPPSEKRYQKKAKKKGSKRKSKNDDERIAFTQYRIGRTMFETDRIPDGWPQRLHHMHEVWVPTAFSEGIFTHAMASEPGNATVRVVPEPVDTDFFRPIEYNSKSTGSNERQVPQSQLPSKLRILQPHIDAGSSIFLFVGKWEERKGIRMLVRAFYEAFSESANNSHNKDHNDVQDSDTNKSSSCPILVVVTSAYHSTNQFDKEIQKILNEEGLAHVNIGGNSPRHILIDNLAQQHMPHLYAAATALVIPSTGEGWGRPHVESMACGTPVVATNWSGPTAYLNSNNGYPLRVSTMQPAGPWVDHKWALPSEEHLVELFIEINNDNHSGVINSPLKQRGIQARKDMVDKYSVKAFRQVIRRELLRIERTAAADARLLVKEFMGYEEHDEF